MKHLLVTNDFPPKHGGIQTLLWELWRRLPPDDFVVLTTPHDRAAAFDAAQPFRVERVRDQVLLPTPMLRRRIDALVRETGAELVMLDPVLPVGALGPHLSVPYAVFMHGSELLGRLPVGDALAGRVLRGARHVIAAGSYPADETRRLTRGQEPPITVVPCGVDSTRFAPLADKASARERFGLPVGVPLVVGVSRLVRRKGFDVLIDAVHRLDGVHLAIGGAGRDADRLARLAGDRVHLVGRIDEELLPSFYGCGDVFAMLCRDQWGGLEKEGFGIVFLEAAACGVPQIAGRSGGSADAVADDETGFVLDDPRDVDAVARAITAALDPATNARMASASRTRAVEMFDYDLLAAAMQHAL
ncbi:MAG: phosphatidyl-myo-inositol dimannoside synthase [Actinomycetota bacterium]|nr:phosphatidyl-myo-inositol dimannoside synthase [Actinomycetota bacterium]